MGKICGWRMAVKELESMGGKVQFASFLVGGSLIIQMESLEKSKPRGTTCSAI